MESLRQFQDAQANAGWRIRLIPYDDPQKPQVIFNGPAMVGALLFIGGFILVARHQPERSNLGFELLIGGFALCLFAILFKARNQRHNWRETTAQCIDSELKEAPLQHGTGWFWRLICEYEYNGRKYRVTPEVYWMNLTSEQAAKAFYDKHVSASGAVQLRFNPARPLQTELKGQGLKDTLLYSAPPDAP